MPKVEVVFFRDDDGTVPALDWLEDVPIKAKDKCLAALIRLGDLGNELRRPIADYLRDGIYELRIGYRGINYRLLYFFHSRTAAVVSHGVVKEKIVPPKEIDRAIVRMNTFFQSPRHYVFRSSDIS